MGRSVFAATGAVGVGWWLHFDFALHGRGPLCAEVAVGLRVRGVLRRWLGWEVGIVAVVGLLVDGLVGRGRAWWWCHPGGSRQRAPTVATATAGVKAAGSEFSC